MRTLLLLLILSLYALSVTEIVPVHQIDVNGTVKDMVLHNRTLVIATDMGHIEVWNIDNYTKKKEVSIPDVKDFMGDIMPARLMSTDVNDGRYLLLSDSGIGGYSNLFLYENGTLKQIFSHKEKKVLIKARFIDHDHILFGYLGNEAALYDLKSNQERYRVQLSESKFSDFALNDDKTLAVFSCESGVLSVIDVQHGKIIRKLEGQNVDNVYKVDFKHNIISGAGQDQRGSLYDVATGKGGYIKGHFLIYATGLSPSASKVAFAMDEKNNITIYNTNTRSKLALLKGQKSTLNVIIFENEKRLYSASDNSSVMVWELNQ
ncbi:MAG: hypothetical protein LGB58_04495 [Sulfurovum sp.]|nr:hypothetical protein [Sulfurovum sp.]